MTIRDFLCASLLVAVSLNSTASEAHPANTIDPAAVICETGNDDLIRQMESELDYADQALPNVPPEEASYLTAESARALAMHNEEVAKHLAYNNSEKIYVNLQARQLYYSWTIRKDLVKLKHDVKRILTHVPKPEELFFIRYPGNDEAEKLQLALEALQPAQLYLSRLDQYNSDVQRAKAPYLAMSKDSYTRVYFAASSIARDLSWFMQCNLAKVMGPQPID